ncbi:MAG: hypothetical protein COA65_08945 [Rhodospirillaceae bacterium]|nr:MAG: hypothetical protein COA65_08945 [Rhodospirillaceae bacterium]
MPARAQEFPEALRQVGSHLPDVLLPYQQKLLATTATNQVTVYEKSRRIGVTWAVGADAVLSSAAAAIAGGMDALYIGYNLDMAREFIDVCAMWAKAFDMGGSDVEEFIFKDRDRQGDRDIQAFRINFASGFEIVALTSKPRSLRGRQGYVILDEAAFHDDLAGMLKAAMALLMWGGKVLIISTHDGDGNAFNQLVNDVRAGRKPYALLRTTFDEALEDGLYERIRLILEAKGAPVKNKEQWRAGIVGFYGEDADEELFCVPAQGSGAFLSGALIESRMTPDAPVLRWEMPDDFVMQPAHIRSADALAWCEENLRPVLAALNPAERSVLGQDFARVADLTVLWPLQIGLDLVRRTPFVVEMRNIPFDQQEQVLFYILDRLPRFSGAAMDAGGNGATLAERAAQRYGFGRIQQVMFSVDWYRQNMPKLKAAFEDATLLIARDDNVLGDLRSIKKIDGVARVPKLRRQDAGNKNKKRHGDAAIALVLAWFASLMEPVEIEHLTTGETRVSAGAFDEIGAQGPSFNDAGFGSVRGGPDFRGY